MRRVWLGCAAAGVCVALWACGRASGPGGAGPASPGTAAQRPAASPDAPNILLIVWDTVRADRLSVNDGSRPTTPFLKGFAAQARVYTDVVSPSSNTVPAHASLFTGLMPSEHGADNEHHPRLDERFDTLAERLQAAGYVTFAYAENPHLSERNRFSQGFDRLVHPWQPEYRDQAIANIKAKIDPADQSNELAVRMRTPDSRLSDWNIKTGGPIGRAALTAWWKELPASPRRPWFAFMNYMDAHRHLIPSRKFREQVMTPEQLARSYKVDRGWDKTWAYCFGLASYTEDELELTRLTYDAALLELDSLFEELIGELEQRGELDNTIIVLTADHGEHLGEHQRLDHQYSVYEPLIRVPLIVRFPKAFAAGSDDRPVSTLDLFPTLLALARAEPAAGVRTAGTEPGRYAVDLRDAPAERARLAEYPQWMSSPIERVKKRAPRHDYTPWQRSLRAYYEGPYKLICGSDGRTELFDLKRDPGELHDLSASEGEVLARMKRGLSAMLAGMTPPGPAEEHGAQTPEEVLRLRELGYAGDEADGDDEAAGETQREAAIVDHCPAEKRP